MMKHEVRYDEEAGALYLRLNGFFTLEDGTELLNLVEKYYEGKQHRNLLCDLTEGPPAFPKEKEFRDQLRELYEEFAFEKIALINVSPVLRVIAKIALAVGLKSGHIKFFKTKTKACAWLKNEH
jgi:hypothetical protein